MYNCDDINTSLFNTKDNAVVANTQCAVALEAPTQWLAKDFWIDEDFLFYYS